MPLQQNIFPFLETVKGATLFGSFNQVQVTVTEVLSVEQSSTPSAPPWELSRNEFPAPSLVPEHYVPVQVGGIPPTTGNQTVLLRTSDCSITHRKEQQALPTRQLSDWLHISIAFPAFQVQELVPGDPLSNSWHRYSDL